MAEQRFDFLRELVKNVPDISLAEEAANYSELDDVQSSPEEQDLFSDSGIEQNKVYNMSQRPSTSVKTNYSTINNNNNNNNNNGGDLRENGIDDIKLRRTRSMQQFEVRKREIEIMERLQQRVATNGNSVIVHTNSIIPKYLRTESMPAKLSTATTKRGKQTSTTTGISSQSSPATPVVSYDFCSKPVVKIDYSNVPSSAPSQLDRETKTLFDITPATTVNSSPISINIDLSSIKIDKTSASNNAVKPKYIEEETTNKAAIKPNTIGVKATFSVQETLLELDEDYDNI